MLLINHSLLRTMHNSSTPRPAFRIALLLLVAAALWSYSSKRPATTVPLPPEENRFTKVVLGEKLDEPMELAPLPDGRVLFIERKGNVKLYSPVTGQIKVIASIPVSTKYTDREGKQTEAEDGLLGLALDPDYDQNHWIYLYYSPAGNEPKNLLTRYEFRGDELVLDSGKVLLEVPVQREQCCHTGGSLAFDAQNNLYLSTGDNTSPRATAYSPVDERSGRSPWDAQKSSGNTNDLRGKIIRIHPEADGGYTIPAGNLFPKGTPKTRPEIYTMGHRNPYRISVDKKTGFLYWGDVGPDSGVDSVNRGPKAEDEFNQARKPGNFGWPYFVGNNKAYWDYDFATGRSGEQFNPDKPVNNSPNNTGLNELPPAQKAMVWYPATETILFPQLGKGGRSAMAGPVYHQEDFRNAKRPFPAYYDGKLFIYEWMRGWMMTVTLDEEGNYLRMERFMPGCQFSNPIEVEFGPDGDLYVLEYGTGWFQGNDDARLVRIEYNGGNRKPLVRLAADKKVGASPLTVHFSSEGTQDFDRDALTYEWKITAKGTPVKTLNEPNPTFTFTKPGVYEALLTVIDAKGEKSTARTDITAGNEPPRLSIDLGKGNQSFYFPNQSFGYAVKVTDKEDGSLANGKIAPSQVALTIDYLKEGFDQVAVAQGHRSADASAAFVSGKKLLEASDCKACHFIDKKSVGPAYHLVAKKYKGDAGATERLANKVIGGGGGAWGDAVMPAHPQLALADTKEIIRYILSLDSRPPNAAKSLPVKGKYTPSVPTHGGERGVFIVRAAYTDKGANGAPPAKAEEVLVLRNPTVLAATAEKLEGVQKFKLPEPPIEMVIVSNSGAYVAFTKIDLTGIDQMEFSVAAPKEQLNAAGGKIEIRLDSTTGPLLGETPTIVPTDGPITAMVPRPVKAKLRSGTAGLHDIYYVFRNEQAKNQALFILFTLQYQPAGITAAGK